MIVKICLSESLYVEIKLKNHKHDHKLNRPLAKRIRELGIEMLL